MKDLIYYNSKLKKVLFNILRLILNKMDFLYSSDEAIYVFKKGILEFLLKKQIFLEDEFSRKMYLQSVALLK